MIWEKSFFANPYRFSPNERYTLPGITPFMACLYKECTGQPQWRILMTSMP